MKDKNKIEIRCENCKHRIFPAACNHCKDCSDFSPDEHAYQARISELHTMLELVQASERAEAREADRLREEVKELEKKLTETVKLLGERSRECGELEAYNEVLQRRIEEFSMELPDRNIKENFTNEEIDFIKKAISMAILDCETNPPKPSDEKINLMWSIKAKCDALLKERVNNE